MEKRRVYQVAKEKKLSSDALISMLKGMEYETKSHMSVVTDDMLEAITRKIDAEKQSSIEEVKRQKTKEEESRKKAEVKAAPAERPASPAEDKKAGRPPRRRAAAAGSAPAAAPPPPSAKETDGRRRARRGKREEPSPAAKEGEATEKKEVATPAAEGAGRSRGRGKRRRSVDAKAVQETVRKTLSQINEGRTRRRYDRSSKEGDEDGATEEPRILTVGEFVTVAELAEQMDVRPTEVIASCLQLGVMVTINQRLDMDTIVTVADEFGFEARPLEAEEEEMLEEFEEEEEVGEPEPRPAVVTVMGHVDHGKTSLLDHLRETNVVEGESGGITQHIGAYVVRMPNGRRITFLDTPGHAAFTAMRARGARVTDLVILVVAADDSVMPQTIEAIDHARAAQVPMVVAINKTDLPTADPERIRRQLSERGVLLEDWGGQVASAEISAKTGAGMDKLLDLVVLEAEMQELKANPHRRARGVIVEAQLDRGRGAVATVLVQEGTLRRGDPFITGVYSGRVRALFDERGQSLDQVLPSEPAEVLGLGGVPQAGDSFVVTASEREARDLSQRRQQMRREQEHRTYGGMTLSDLHYQIQQGKIKDLKVVVKGDVDGSVEAINQELGAIAHEEVRVFVIHSGVGAISESDVLLASASDAIIIGFGVQPDTPAREMATRSGVEIRLYDVIYEVIEEIRAGLAGLLAPAVEERVVGAAQVREVFSSSRFGSIAGCMVQQGKITRNLRVRVVRDGEQVFAGEIASLRRFRDDVREVLEGYECGIGLEGFDEIAEDDVIESLEVVETARTL